MKKGEPISEILMGKLEIEREIADSKVEFEGKIENARRRREALIVHCKERGLTVQKKEEEKAIDDLIGASRVDAEGKLIECTLRVEANSAEQAQVALQICREKNLMALPIGGRTSGLGVFEAMGTASQKGFDGVLGIQMQLFGGDEVADSQFQEVPTDIAEFLRNKEVKPEHHRVTAEDISSFRSTGTDGEKVRFATSRPSHAHLIEIPSYDESEYKLIRHQRLPIALLKSKNFPNEGSKPHRVIAHAGCTVELVNAFLANNLSDPRFGYKILNDLTTRRDAQLGGVFSTGAEGGNRTKMEEDIHGSRIVNGNGAIEDLNREESQKIIGLNGITLVTQLDLEVTAFPKHEHAIFIPLKGNGAEAWKNMLKLQQKLGKYCRGNHNNRRLLKGAGDSGLIITGMEPLSRSAINIALEKSTAHSDDMYKKSLGENEMGVYVTFSSFTEEGIDPTYEFLNLFEEELGRDLGCPEEPPEEDFQKNAATGNFVVPSQPTHDEMCVLTGAERKRMDEIRHAAPDHSKKKAEELGGQTQSTDLNIRFNSDSEDENETAMAAVATLYHEYASAFRVQDGFRVVVYGHLHPGLTEEGGGFDPHVRIIFELSNPNSRFNAPEMVVWMKKKQVELYHKLMALDGKHGIEIRCPEKSRFANAEYWKWFCLYHPEEAREHLKAVERYGYSDDGRPYLGARVPHEMAGTLRKVPGGIKAILNKNLIDETEQVGDERIAGIDPLLKKYWPAILEVSQLSHRGGTIKRMVGEVQRSMREKWGLAETQYAFFIESPKEAEAIVRRNFGADFEDQGYKIKYVRKKELEALQGKFPPDEKTFYVVDLAVAGVPKGLSVLITPHESIKDAYEKTLTGQNRASFRNFYKMWEKWPYETDETPNLPAVAALGVLLQRDELDQHEGATRPPIKTTNPGPGQIHDDIREHAKELFETLKKISKPSEQKKVIQRFKNFVGIPQNHRLAFFTSATQIMQMVADAMAKEKDHLNVIQITNDAFSERWYGILESEGVPVRRVTTPWSTSEHSEMERVVRKIIENWDDNKKNILAVTPHKTSTAADFAPQRLIDALAAEGKKLGRDYEMICDITSGIGARDYATLPDPDAETGRRMPFTGMLGSLQKGMQQAPGIAAVSFSENLQKMLGIRGVTAKERKEFSLANCIEDTERGRTINPLAVAMLKQKLDADEESGVTVEKIEKETRKKVALVMGWMQRHDDLMTLTPDWRDASPLLFGIFSQKKNLVVAKRILAEVFGYYVGGGYGPYEKEAIRLYLPNIAYNDLKKLLAALDYVLNLEDVVKTRGEQKPNIALREPHNPLSVIDRLAGEMRVVDDMFGELTVDDIFRESLALHWLERLFKTYNSIQQTKGGQTIKLGGRVPETSGDFRTRALIYDFEENTTEMAKILTLKGGADLPFTLEYYYHDYLQTEAEIKARVLGDPGQIYGQDMTFTAIIDTLIERAKGNLKNISRLLHKYVEGDGNGMGKAARDEEGRVKWAIAA